MGSASGVRVSLRPGYPGAKRPMLVGRYSIIRATGSQMGRLKRAVEASRGTLPDPGPPYEDQGRGKKGVKGGFLFVGRQPQVFLYGGYHSSLAILEFYPSLPDRS